MKNLKIIERLKKGSIIFQNLTWVRKVKNHGTNKKRFCELSQNNDNNIVQNNDNKALYYEITTIINSMNIQIL